MRTVPIVAISPKLFSKKFNLNQNSEWFITELKLILNHMKLSQVKTDKAIWEKKMKNERIFALELIAVI